MSELNPSPELIAVALAAVAKHRDRKYPTGEDRAALCSASIVLADAWSRRADDAGRLMDNLKGLRDEAAGMLLNTLIRDNDRLRYEKHDGGKRCRGCGEPYGEPCRMPCYIYDCLKGTCCDTGDLGTKHDCQKRKS